MLRILLRLAALLFALGVAAALALVLAFYIQYRRDDHPIVLPAPRGPHPVGRVLMDWKDTARGREVMVFIWYPAQAGAAGKRVEYIPGKWGDLEARNMIPIPEKHLRDMRGNAIESAPVAEGARPLLVLLPGMGRIPAHHTTIAEDLASYGYVIAGVTPTGSSRPVVFADGRVVEGKEDWNLDDKAVAEELIKTWVGDASFAIDQLARDTRFADRIQLAKLGIFGHSFGGNAAVHALHLDPRFLRAANLDGGYFGDPDGRPDKPLLILEGAAEIDPEWKKACSSATAQCTTGAFPEARHMNFSDAAILPSRFPFPKSLMMLGDVDGRQFLFEISDRVRAFFDQM
jgi:predicted dienelactone hydrolase